MSRAECSMEGCEKPSRARTWCSTHWVRWRKYGDPSVCLSNHHIPLLERFWMKVQKGPGCWQWTGAVSGCGYGTFGESSAGSQRRVHRLSYELMVGPIPEGLELDHTCRNKTCVNPSHLRPVTRKQNIEHASGPRRNSTTGVLGVTHRKQSGNYVASVVHHGKRVHGGTFKSLEEAAVAVKALRLSLFTHNDVDRKVS